jgi:hypothetical protein
MGASLDVWRQRIGLFTMPSSKEKPLQMEAYPCSGSWRMGIGGATFARILFAVAIASMYLNAFPARCNTVTSCGDVEQNPGPLTPMLEDVFLQQLHNKDPQISLPSFTLRNKHIHQLHEFKKCNHCSWETVVEWLKVLIPTFPKGADDIQWDKKINKQWGTLLNKRLLLLKSKKRNPAACNEWDETTYNLPSVTGQRNPRSATCHASSFMVEVTKEQNKQLIQENASLKQENEVLSTRLDPHECDLLKRRLEQHKTNNKKLRKDNMDLEKELEKSATKCEKNKRDKKRLSAAVCAMQKKMDKLEDMPSTSESQVVEILTSSVNDLQEMCDLQKEQIKQLKNQNAELKDENRALKSKTLKLKDEKGTFLPLVNRCVWKLLDCNVSFGNIGKVMEVVLEMVDVKLGDKISQTTVRNMNAQRLLVAQEQLKDLRSRKNTTISTDETPKAGNVYMTYTITDDNQQSFVLGLRQMVSKSAKHTLDMLKIVLSDISDICRTNSLDKGDTGLKILTQIKNTMSDRAATETKFNDLLATYRSECLPLMTEGWDHFTKEAKGKMNEMNNFFCGLHLLTSIAESVAVSFKKFEDTFLDGQKAGAANVAGVTVLNSTESGTLRLVRNTCKAFARGGDDKSGCHRDWKTYMKTVHNSKTFFLPFRGNRFNVVFLFGGYVYHLQDKIKDFLSAYHGQTNGLLKAVYADCCVPLYIAGCKVLGLVNKLISAPLWRFTESEGHIIEMVDFYTKMDNFLKEVTMNNEKLIEFSTGEFVCFPDDQISQDEVYSSIIRRGQHDEITMGMLQHTLLTIRQTLHRMTHQFLPGGEFYKNQKDASLQEVTKSVPKHNKLPERIFGYFGYLLGKRPNSSDIANEAQVMFLLNKTADYVSKLSNTDLGILISKVRTEERDLRKKAKQRQQDLFKELIERQEQKKREIETSRMRTLKRKEDLTSIIVDAGLWQTFEMVESKMNDADDDKERYNACKNQIKFRRQCLQQYLPEDKGFTFTEKGGKPKHWKVLRDHLNKFISAAICTPMSKSCTKTPDNEHFTVPLLTGKTVDHSYNDEDDSQTIYRGQVISQVPGFPSWYNIKYEGDEAIYSYKLVDDYKEGNLTIVVDN